MTGHFLKRIFFFWLALCTAGAVPCAAGREAGTPDIRRSILAGSWYPGSREALARAVRGYLSLAGTTRLNGTLKGIIVPHAGYRYSGLVAAHAFRLLRGKHFRRVVLVGPSHRMAFKGVSVNLQSAYETPLGRVRVDRAFGKRLVASAPGIRWLRQAHAREHSLEIELPFLQSVLDDFRIVPIVMGQQDLETCTVLAKALARLLGDETGTLLLASSDLSHYHTYDRAMTLDRRFIRHVAEFDPPGLFRDLLRGRCEACGGGPVIAVLMAAREAGADRAVILAHANSGDVTGDRERVVGYMSAALIRASGTDPRPK